MIIMAKRIESMELGQFCYSLPESSTKIAQTALIGPRWSYTEMLDLQQYGLEAKFVHVCESLIRCCVNAPMQVAQKKHSAHSARWLVLGRVSDCRNHSQNWWL